MRLAIWFLLMVCLVGIDQKVFADEGGLTELQLSMCREWQDRPADRVFRNYHQPLCQILDDNQPFGLDGFSRPRYQEGSSYRPVASSARPGLPWFRGEDTPRINQSRPRTEP